MSQCPSSNLLIEIEELGSGPLEDDITLGDDIYIADEGLVDECEDIPSLVGYIQIRPVAVLTAEASPPADPMTSTLSRRLVSIAVQRPPHGVTLAPRLDTTTAREITPAPQVTASLPTTDDPLRTSIFYTYVKINGHACKVIMDSGSCVNAVSDHVLQTTGLSTISHLAPYDISWIDATTLPVCHQFQVPLRVSTYDEHILCDVLPMKVGGIILGRPWLYDYDVQLLGRANTCSFMYRDRRLVWYPHNIKPVATRDPGSRLGLIVMKGPAF